VNEDLIVVRFDVTSVDSFTADMAASLLQSHILDDEMKEHLEKNPILNVDCLEVWDAIADSLNDRIRMMVDEVLNHAQTTFKILDAISSEDNTTAYALALNLVADLLAYEPAATQIWGFWVADVMGIVKP
jgi:hypothetical protein